MKSSDIILGIVSFDSPPFFGGMGRHVGELVQGFRREGIQVHIFDRTFRPFFSMIGRSVGFSIGLRKKLQTFIFDHHISLLHIHGGPGGVLLPFLPHGIPVVITANHTYKSQSLLPGQWWKRIFIPCERRMYQKAHALIAISEDTKESLINYYGISANRISVIHCGFTLSPWITADKQFSERSHNSCVFIGRPDTRKGWDLLCKAWSLVHAKNPYATLSVVGWKDVARDGITFLGRLSDTDLQALVGSARCIICPSRLEGFGLSAAESITSGTPVVATRVAGLQCVVEDNSTGIFVETYPEAIAAGILKILDDTPLWHQLHEGCQNRHSRFDILKEIQTHLQSFHEL